LTAFSISVLLEVESLKIKKEINMAVPFERFERSKHGLEVGGMAVFIPGGAAPDKSRPIREDYYVSPSELSDRQSASSEGVGRVVTHAASIKVSPRSEALAS
jgi:hypothetical protein